MLKRSILAAVAVCALAAVTQAQESATIVLRSGEKISGQLLDMGGVGFTVRVSGQERQIPTNDVAIIDFTGSGDVSDADWNKVTSGQSIWLRNGQTVEGQLTDVGGTSPLRLTVRSASGERNYSSAEVARIILARPTAVATSGSATAGVPEGAGIAVPGNQQWTATGITVRSGERLTFNTTGEIRLNAEGSEVASSAGARSQRLAPGAPLPSAYVGALIGRIGNSAPFAIGNSTTIVAPASGQLFLGVNDDHVADNQGGFRVDVQRAGRR